MPLLRRHKLNPTVPMLRVVPSHKRLYPRPALVQIFKPLARIRWRKRERTKKASEYRLSSLTQGRLNEGTSPSFCSFASIVAPFIGLPLSEC